MNLLKICHRRTVSLIRTLPISSNLTTNNIHTRTHTHTNFVQTRIQNGIQKRIQFKHFSTSSEPSPSTTPPSTPPSIIPGLALSATTMGVGFASASLLTAATAIPISGIPLSILFGLAAGNTLKLPSTVKPGVTFATKTVLQTGIGENVQESEIAKPNALSPKSSNSKSSN